MNRKLFRASRLAALLVAAVLLCAPMLTARAVSQADIDALQERRSSLAQRAAEQEAAIVRLNETHALCVERKLALDACIETNREEIDVLTQEAALYDQLLLDKEQELNLAMEDESRHTRQLRARIRSMEERGETGYLNVLLASTSLTDLLSRIADIRDISHYDQQLEQQYQEARDEKETVLGEYQELVQQQQSVKTELASKQAYLDSQVAAAQTLLAGISDESDRAEEEYAAMQTALDEADAEITAMILRWEEEKRLAAEEAARQAAAAAAAAQLAAQAGQGDGTVAVGVQGDIPVDGAGTVGAGGGLSALGSLSWPVPASNLVTSEYGERTQPTAGASTNHQGMDIGAAAGSSIVAAGSGIVIASAYNDGYGNYVVIDHGDGTTTLYAHMEQSTVTVGQAVDSSQLIGYVGSTGIATGPHCHFEVKINGQNTDPESYYSGFQIW